jgi:hypothetical protein
MKPKERCFQLYKLICLAAIRPKFLHPPQTGEHWQKKKKKNRDNHNHLNVNVRERREK